MIKLENLSKKKNVGTFHLKLEASVNYELALHRRVEHFLKLISFYLLLGVFSYLFMHSCRVFSLLNEPY